MKKIVVTLVVVLGAIALMALSALLIVDLISLAVIGIGTLLLLWFLIKMALDYLKS